MSTDLPTAPPEPAREDLLEAVRQAWIALSACKDEDGLLRLAVLEARERLGLDRVGILLYDPATGTRRGSWGTDEEGRLADERAFVGPLGPEEEYILAGLRDRGQVVVWEDRELRNWDRPVGRGWNAMAPLWDGPRALGWLAADNLLRFRPFPAGLRPALALYAALLANLLAGLRRAALLEAAVAERTAEAGAAEARALSLYEGLRKESADKDKLFTILAHDLRGPLGSLKTLFDLAAAEEGSGAPPAAAGIAAAGTGAATGSSAAAESLAAILPAARASLASTYALVDNLLEWVRGRLGAVAELREPLPLKAAIEGVAASFALPLAEKGLRVVVSASPGAVAVVDRRAFETIVRNLLSNAVKFSPPGKTILVEAGERNAAGELLVRVRDRGAGIEPERLDSIFRMDPRKRRPGTRGEPGSGLGLVFCRDLAEGLGGRLWAESPPGGGGDFVLALPDRLEGELPAAD